MISVDHLLTAFVLIYHNQTEECMGCMNSQVHSHNHFLSDGSLDNSCLDDHLAGNICLYNHCCIDVSLGVLEHCSDGRFQYSIEEELQNLCH